MSVYHFIAPATYTRVSAVEDRPVARDSRARERLRAMDTPKGVVPLENATKSLPQCVW